MIVALSCTHPKEHAFDKSKLDSLLAHIERNDQAMGSVSIFRNGEEVYQKTFGFANLEDSVRADAQTRYRVGSISKTFTATIIMQLVFEGKLSLDTKLDEFLPK